MCTYQNGILEPHSREGPIKFMLSVCLSVFLSVCQLGIFLRNSSFDFSDFLHDGRYLEYLKTDRNLFPRKIHFCPNLGKKDPKWPPKRFFWVFLKNFVFSLRTPRFNVRCSLCPRVALRHCHVHFNSWNGSPYTMLFYFEPTMHPNL